MGRGHGAVQRHILARLGETPGEWVPLIELVEATERGPNQRRVTRLYRSRFESTRRAVFRLAAPDDSDIEMKWAVGTVPEFGAWGWPARRRVIHVRLKP
jgi:hypothetical protein